MSEVSYTVNGRTIDLEQVATEAYSETPIMDERGNYVLTQFDIRWRGYYNPATVSYRRVGQALLNFFGEFPPTTENAVRHFLSQPRGQLIWTVNSIDQLRSPIDGATIDSQNGPIPVVHQINKVEGNKTYEVVWGVTTWLSECDKWTSSPPTMLSNTWEQSETITGDEGRYYCVRVTNGRAKFDTSRIPAAYVPDDYRRWVLPALLNGFRRDRIDVTATADGSAIQYQVVDVEQRVGMRARDVSKIDVIQSAGVTLPSITNTINTTVNAVGTSYSAGMVAAKTAEKAGLSNRAVEGIGRAGAILAFAQAFAATIPVESYEITVKVWGTKNASMAYLQGIGDKIISFRLLDRFTRTGFTSGLKIIQDPVAGMVQYNFSFVSGFFAGVGASNNSVYNFMFDIPDHIHPDVAVKHDANMPVASGAVNASDEGSNVPPMNNNTRGYFLGRLMSQALAGDCEKPAAPTAQRIADPVPGNPNR